jgi:hypothetical protein
VCVPGVIAQPNADASDHADRQKAAALFGQGKRLEALPLLEGLVQKRCWWSSWVSLARFWMIHFSTDPCVVMIAGGLLLSNFVSSG